MISTAEAVAMANQVKAVKYLECSAKTMEGVKALFDEAITAGLTHEKKRSEEWMRRNRCLFL